MSVAQLTEYQTQTADPESLLVQHFNQGSADAFLQLYERIAPLLLSMITARVRDEALASDIFQDVWVTAITKISTYRTENFRGWLWTIAKNRILDHARREARTKSLSMSHETASKDDAAHTPMSLLEQADEKRIVKECLSRLATRDRKILLLRYFEAKSYSEIAGLVQVEEGTVASRLSRAKQRVGECVRSKSK